MLEDNINTSLKYLVTEKFEFLNLMAKAKQ